MFQPILHEIFLDFFTDSPHREKII